MAVNHNYGFVLTRKAYDNKAGMVISLWLITPQGPVNLNIDDEQAIFFIETIAQEKALRLLKQQGIHVAKASSLSLKSFNQVPVTALYFSYLRDFYQARELLKQHKIKCYEDDIRPEERYLMERFITDNAEFAGNQIHSSHSFASYFGAKCKKASGNASLRMVSIDLECSPKGELYSIGLYAKDLELVMMISEKELHKQGNDYIEWVADETTLLTRFIEWVKSYDPDIFIGWNVVNFDFNLLQKRFDLHNIPFILGRDNREPSWRHLKSSEQRFIDIAGRVVLDGIDLLKTATYNFPSFSLDNVARVLLGKAKKVEDVDNRLKEIVDNFNHNKHALAAYNLEDCKLVWEIFEHTQLLEFAMLRTKLTGLTLDRVGGSVAAFTNLYLPKLHRAGYIAPNLGDGKSDLVSPGGYVMDSTPGLYNNVLVLDFKSLYPSIIRTFFIDPMGLVEGINAQESAVEGFDGAYFSRDKHFLPAIIDELWHERDIAKQNNNAALSQAIKIIMNSFYGVLGSTGCRFFDPRLSGSITKRGHQILKTTKQWIEEKGYRVIYGDTDSIFVHIGDNFKAEQAFDKGKELQEFINQTWTKTLAEQYKVTSKLEIEFETHFTKFFMPTIRGLGGVKEQNIGTKKRYAGLSKDKLVFKGLETVRSDWTGIAKMFQQELYRLIFNNLPIREYITTVVNGIREGKHDELLVYSKRIRRRLEDYANTPPHIKAAKDANKQLNKVKYKRGVKIEYVFTLAGVVTRELQNSPLDYDYYIEKQIKPIADDILPFISEDFENIAGQQMGLF